jgi:hypothetical protein
VEQQRSLLGFTCAGQRFAVPLAWSHAVEDDYELIDVPNAPAWLAGLTSVGGIVSPVVDFHMLLDDSAGATALSKRRLLVGGRDESTDNRSIALLFDGLPIHLEAGVESPMSDYVPSALASAVVATYAAADASGEFWVLDPTKLYEQLSAQLEG